MESKKRRLPEGIQSFEEIRRDGYLYVDKTDLVWQLVNGCKFNYLSRPRRFGKSLLVDTLACYFEGKKELFEGLKIMQLEKEWKKYPVIRLDMSKGGASAKELNDYINSLFLDYEEQYDIETYDGDGLTARFSDIIETAAKTAGQSTVILVDGFDTPLLNSWQTPEFESVVDIYRQVFVCLKAYDRFEHFVFLTGITKFTNLPLFAGLNNLTYISFRPQCAALCGFTKQELLENFMPEIEYLAEKNKWSVDETISYIKEYYGGYHFSRRNMVEVYNPFSIVQSLAKGQIGNYWTSSDFTTLLPKFVDNIEQYVEDLDDKCAIAWNFDALDATDCYEIFLYQSGYLTIKDADADCYYLSIPNREVRHALFEDVMPLISMPSSSMTRVRACLDGNE